jgi:hypothetical protein
MAAIQVLNIFPQTRTSTKYTQEANPLSPLQSQHPSLHHNLPHQSHIPTTRPHKHSKLPTRHTPLPALPHTQIPPSQLKRRRPTRPSLELQLCEPPQLFRRLAGAGWVPDIQLRHLSACDAARVRDLGSYDRDCFPEVCGSAGANRAWRASQTRRGWSR